MNLLMCLKQCVFILSIIISINKNSAEVWDNLIETTDILKQDYNVENLKKLIESIDISFECKNSLKLSFDSFEKLDEWSYRMFKSWGNFPPKGLMEGTLVDFGEYDQCISIKPNEVIGKAQYCLVDINLPLPRPMPKHHNIFHKIKVYNNYENKSSVFTSLAEHASDFYWFYLRVGVCGPEWCSKKDIQTMITSAINITGLKLKNLNCQIDEEFKYNLTQLFTIIFLSLFVMISIVSTIILEAFKFPKGSKNFKVFKVFSLKQNFRKIFSTKTTDELTCINGIRFWSVIWVITGHTFEYAFYSGIYTNLFEMKHLMSMALNHFTMNAHYVVETFFFISGFLSTYMRLKFTNGKMDKYSNTQIMLIRYIRLTPQILIIILMSFLMPFFGSGPLWNQYINPIVDNCYKYWWSNLLFLQNFINPMNMCAIQTWYLGADMQLHLISSIVFFALKKSFFFGHLVNGLIIVFLVSLSSYLIVVNDYPPGMVSTGRDEFYDTVWVPDSYYKPWPHGSVLFIGLWFGHMVYKYPKVKMSIMKAVSIWFLILVGFIFASLYNVYWSTGQPYNIWVSAIIYPMTRVIWALCMGSMIWMCVCGHGGFISNFLSWKAYVPLSRLVYPIYLTHFFVIWIYWNSRRSITELTLLNFMCVLSGMVLLSFVFGTIFSLVFESPFLYLKSLIKVEKEQKT